MCVNVCVCMQHTLGPLWTLCLCSCVNERLRPSMHACLQQNIHTHTHMHTCTHTHTRTHTCTHTRACTHTHTHIHTHTHARTHTRTHTHTNTHEHTHTHTHAHARTHTHARTRAHTHSHTHTHAMHAHVARVMGLANSSASLAALPHLSHLLCSEKKNYTVSDTIHTLSKCPDQYLRLNRLLSVRKSTPNYH